MLILRSLLFNAAFYLNTVICLIAALPTFLMPYWGIVWVAKTWGRINLVLLRVICGTKAEFRGLEKIPQGGLLVASKHQSTWETFALLWLFDDPTFILKRELQWIPLFGWFTIKGRMVPVRRGAGSQALAEMGEHARVAFAEGRQIVIFPEGTRRPAGAEPRYKIGVAFLYENGGVPCLPIALNSGVFWPRRSFLRMPGTVVVEILDPIPPGLSKDEFMQRLQQTIEPVTTRLIEEARASSSV